MGRGARDSITLAAARGDEASVLGFLEREPASVNDGDTLEKRPLSTAIEGGHRTIVELLLNRGADPRLPESRTCMHGFALMAASIRDDVEIAKRVLGAGADPNAEMDSSGTPAGRATSDRMRCLLYEHGGKPLSIWAYIQSGQFETVAAILRYTPDPFTQDGGDWSSTPFTAIVSGAERSLRNGGSDEVYWAMLRFFSLEGLSTAEGSHGLSQLLVACPCHDASAA
jgi:ankyrin repeat protein